jgi:2'-5' RNA ligase
VGRSALVIRVGEAEPIVSATRARHDSSAAAGMPAHITLLFPFVESHLLDDATREQVVALGARQAAFRFSLTALRRFPSALYLVPVPAEPFRSLVRSLAAAFPAHPPYGGAFDEIVPHLTLADSSAVGSFDEIASEFAHRHGRRLPIDCTARHIALFVHRGGRWQEEWTVPLAQGSATAGTRS